MEKPPIRILQRPCQASDNKTSHIQKPPAAFKTLEQREADYAAARRRIMESEDCAPSEDEVVQNESTKTTMVSGTEGSPSRQVPSSMGVVSATPLMSITAAPVSMGLLQTDCDPSTTPSWANKGITQSRSMHGMNPRQGYAVVNVAQKLQQQQPLLSNNVTRSTTQQSRILNASASSPSFFHPRTTSQPVPLLPSHSSAMNTGLLPTPPGFNYSTQNSTPTGVGHGGLHHSQSAAYALMQTFGLFQQQYQQALLNGFQNPASVSSTIPNTGTSLNPFTFSSVASQSNCSHKFTRPSPFN